MLRRGFCRLAFTPAVPKSWSPKDCVPFGDVAEKVFDAVTLCRSPLLLRSEPQSGKTSLARYIAGGRSTDKIRADKRRSECEPFPANEACQELAGRKGLASIAAATVAAATCGRVGLSNFVAHELVTGPFSPTLLASKGELGSFCQEVAQAALKALLKTRLLKGDNGPWKFDQPHLVAAAIQEGCLRQGLFKSKLFSSAGLRAVGKGQLENTNSRYIGTPVKQEVERIDDDELTPVAPYAHCFAIEATKPNSFMDFEASRYTGVVDAMKLLPIAVDEPTTAVDVFLRAWPSIDAIALFCGQGTGTDRRTDFIIRGGHNTLPRDVGGFQAAFAGAMTRRFGVNKETVTQDDQVDFVYILGPQRKFAFELLVGCETLLGEHHERWGTKYKSWLRPPHCASALTVVFVESAQWEAAVRTAKEKCHLKEVPPIIVACFRYGAFVTQCVLCDAGRTVEFTLDLDGVAMKLRQDGKGVEIAQRIPAQDRILEQWMIAFREENPGRISVWLQWKTASRP